MKPFLKWAGGKRWLASSGLMPRPDDFENYIEPFLGGGAVFFSIAPKSAIVSDVNEELINLYQCIRDVPEEITALMQNHQEAHCARHFYEVRADAPDSAVKRAARTLYLNRTCWNGLYRVNLKGQFNVPIGTKSKVFDPDECFLEVAKRLKNADISCCDFAETIDKATANDFLFVDPPYTVRHNENGFLKYNETIFSWADQVRLHNSLKDAADRGTSIVITNADHPSLHELYADFQYRKLFRSSVLAGKNSGRGQTSEAMFYANVDLPDEESLVPKGSTAVLKFA